LSLLSEVTHINDWHMMTVFIDECSAIKILNFNSALFCVFVEFGFKLTYLSNLASLSSLTYCPCFKDLQWLSKSFLWAIKEHLQNLQYARVVYPVGSGVSHAKMKKF